MENKINKDELSKIKNKVRNLPKEKINRIEQKIIKQTEATFDFVDLDSNPNRHATINVVFSDVKYASLIEEKDVQIILAREVDHFYNLANMKDKSLAEFVKFINERHPELNLKSIGNMQFTIVKTVTKAESEEFEGSM